MGTVAQGVKDPMLLQLWHRSQLRLRFSPWPGNFHMLPVQPTPPPPPPPAKKKKPKQAENYLMRSFFMTKTIWCPIRIQLIVRWRLHSLVDGTSIKETRQKNTKLCNTIIRQSVSASSTHPFPVKPFWFLLPPWPPWILGPYSCLYSRFPHLFC